MPEVLINPAPIANTMSFPGIDVRESQGQSSDQSGFGQILEEMSSGQKSVKGTDNPTVSQDQSVKDLKPFRNIQAKPNIRMDSFRLIESLVQQVDTTNSSSEISSPNDLLLDGESTVDDGDLVDGLKGNIMAAEISMNGVYQVFQEMEMAAVVVPVNAVSKDVPTDDMALGSPEISDQSASEPLEMEIAPVTTSNVVSNNTGLEFSSAPSQSAVSNLQELSHAVTAVDNVFWSGNKKIDISSVGQNSTGENQLNVTAEQVASLISESEFPDSRVLHSLGAESDWKTAVTVKPFTTFTQNRINTLQIPLVLNQESKPVLQTATPAQTELGEGQTFARIAGIVSGSDSEESNIDLSLLQTERVLDAAVKKEDNGVLANISAVDIQKGDLVKTQGQWVESGKTSSFVDKESVFSQIIDQAKVMVDHNNSQMEISLRPDYLGKIQLKISLENQLISARFVAESEQVKSLIETNLNDLKQMLHQNGVQVDSIMVFVGQQGNEGQNPTGNPFYDNFQQNLAGNGKGKFNGKFETEMARSLEQKEPGPQISQIDLIA